ncbi:MAG TPA: aminoacyl-tRNA deacylase [Roseiflexaceae bacterium]|nr:aminoacyl-tRNA deacylase [Roseiflexaceae bacterium]
MKRTKAIEILTQAGVPHEVREFAANEFTAEEAARELGLPLGQLFKTLVVRGERQGIVMALVPGDCALSLRKLALAIGDKRADLVEQSELTRLTGYLKGGVSPLGGRQSYPVLIDERAILCERISVSAGLRGLQILLAPDDLIRATGGSYADLAE